MLSVFKKSHKNDFTNFMKDYNFYYLEDDEVFIGFYESLMFKVRFEVSGYGSRISMLYSAHVPLLEKELNLSSVNCIQMEEITSFKWTLDFKKLSEKDIILQDYINDMKYIIENYVFNIYSATINSFNIKSAINDKYYEEFNSYLRNNNLENAARKYRGDFLESGKKRDEYTKINESIALELEEEQRKEIFPFKVFEETISHRINNNKTKYKIIRNKYSRNLLHTKEISFINDDKFLYSSKYGKAIINCLNENGYFHDKSSFFVQKNLFRHVDNPNLRVNIRIDNHLFLYFIIYEEDSNPNSVSAKSNFFRKKTSLYKSKRIAKYDYNPFLIGWLLGNRDNIDLNVKKSIQSLCLKVQDK